MREERLFRAESLHERNWLAAAVDHDFSTTCGQQRATRSPVPDTVMMCLGIDSATSTFLFTEVGLWIAFHDATG